MLLTITYAGQNTTDLGYLLYKNPYRPQVTKLNHGGKAYVFYPEISDERTTAALLLDIDPVELARGKAGSPVSGLFDYVNDRPYVASSFMSTAISKVFGTAMTGRADSRQALSDSQLDLTATVNMLPCRGEREMLNRVFEPLGYAVSYETFAADEHFPSWGESDYVNLTIRGNARLRDLLKHLYVLIPVFDRQKHYWVGEEEVKKLLRLGEDWLYSHPERTYITSRYLKQRRALVNMAFERLVMANAADGEIIPVGLDELYEKPDIDKPDIKLSLNKQRLDSVVTALKENGVKSVIDIGCGDGHLLDLLIKDGHFTSIAGVDVSHTALKHAMKRLKLEKAGDSVLERVKLFQGSLTYKDGRFAGYDAACIIEVIEHLDIPRITAFERILFGLTKPRVVVLTTPNKEYNIHYRLSYSGDKRHDDHRFEWTRAEFRDWSATTADKYGYSVQFSEIGDMDEICGAPTQMGVFTLC